MTSTDEQPRTRLADLAALSGVSTATVSRVLNRRPGVADATRQAVYNAMDMLGYERPRRSPSQSAGLIGLIVPELSNPVFPAFAQAIETALAHHGYTPLLCTQTASGVSEDEYVETLLAANVAGIVFVNGLHADSQAPTARYERLVELGVPFVLVNGYREELQVPTVSVDEVLGMDIAVRHLTALGHTRIALAVGQERLVPSMLKRQGFVTAMKRYLGPTAEHRVMTSLFTVEGGEASAWALMREGVTAIICGSDLMALGAVRAVTAAGRCVPEDVSVVGFDDSVFLGFTDPPLTTLRQPVPGMSQAAVDLLLQSIRGRTQATELRFAPELIVRGSTTTAPAGGAERS
ncbi:MAG: LacI family transcriptional regulator [Micrococcales bacterium 73-15]|uniref:LacI family DNA-binding transcriptional regulator n=1 Tax=Salana multivorans TaxID=120377 RepID=UPI0009684470|nr:LacI family DNA-binding transcriptional regulator [Salana multivorans]OJX94653.1 MAG: LacI family transcriptional regulator [Micrococcales bacterium 73-15]